jgi:hypothetical protein
VHGLIFISGAIDGPARPQNEIGDQKYEMMAHSFRIGKTAK